MTPNQIWSLGLTCEQYPHALEYQDLTGVPLTRLVESLDREFAFEDQKIQARYENLKAYLARELGPKEEHTLTSLADRLDELAAAHKAHPECHDDQNGCQHPDCQRAIAWIRTTNQEPESEYSRMARYGWSGHGFDPGDLLNEGAAHMNWTPAVILPLAQRYKIEREQQRHASGPWVSAKITRAKGEDQLLIHCALNYQPTKAETEAVVSSWQAHFTNEDGTRRTWHQFQMDAIEAQGAKHWAKRNMRRLRDQDRWDTRGIERHFDMILNTDYEEPWVNEEALYRYAAKVLGYKPVEYEAGDGTIAILSPEDQVSDQDARAILEEILADVQEAGFEIPMRHHARKDHRALAEGRWNKVLEERTLHSGQGYLAGAPDIIG